MIVNDQPSQTAIVSIREAALSSATVPITLYRSFYAGHPAGFGPWVDAVNKEISRDYGVVLIKRGEVYRVATVEQSIRRADAHGRKMQRQASYKVQTLDGLMRRADIPDESRSVIQRKRDKAADVSTDLRTAMRKRQRNPVVP